MLLVMYLVVGITLTMLAALTGQVPRPAELSLRDFTLPLFDLAAFVMSYRVPSERESLPGAQSVLTPKPRVQLIHTMHQPKYLLSICSTY